MKNSALIGVAACTAATQDDAYREAMRQRLAALDRIDYVSSCLRKELRDSWTHFPMFLGRGAISKQSVTYAASGRWSDVFSNAPIFPSVRL